MFTFIKNIFIISTCLFILCGCNSKKETAKDILFVSIEPQRYFLDMLVKDHFDVQTLIPYGSNPENFDPTPSQMLSVGKSSMYFKIGLLNFEKAWLNNIKMNNPDMVIVDCSENIPYLGGCADHSHNHGHGHDGEDPHIWSSPKTVLQIVQNMYDAVVGYDEKNRYFYNKNLIEIERHIQNTDSIIKHYLDRAPSKSFIIFHPALSYFASEYGLNQLSIENSGKQPSPHYLKELIDLGKKENVKVVFIQEEFDKKNAETIAQEIGAKVVTLNLLSYNWDTELIKIAKALSLQDE